MIIYIGADHGGFALKSYIVNFLKQSEYDVYDTGCYSEERCDYPDCAKIVCDKVINDKESLGILVCGTGIGISIAANKFKNIRCALCNDIFSGEMAKRHNNANVIAMGGRIINHTLAIKIIETFLNSNFDGGRHQTRLDKIKKIENN